MKLCTQIKSFIILFWQVAPKRTNVPGLKKHRARRYNPFMDFGYGRPFMPPPYYAPYYGYGSASEFFIDLYLFTLGMLWWFYFFNHLHFDFATCTVNHSQVILSGQNCCCHFWISFPVVDKAFQWFRRAPRYRRPTRYSPYFWALLWCVFILSGVYSPA